MKIIVVGGGISGLASAHFLAKAGHDVSVVEPRAPGGVMGSERRDGYLCERGPQALLSSSPAVQTLIDDLGLRPRVLSPRPEAKRRLLYLGGRLQAVPMSPPALLSTSLLSWRGRLRLFAEPFVRRRRAPEDAPPESLRDFAARRLGTEVADKLLGPAVMAVYAGDVKALEAKSAFPSLVAWEREHGSMFRGAIKTARQNKGRPRGIVSFPDGLHEIAAAISSRLGAKWISAEARALTRTSAGWRIELGPMANAKNEVSAVLEGDAVVVASNVTAAASLLEPFLPAAASALRGIPVAPAAVVHLGFRGPATDLGMDLGAYGFIAARGEGIHLLGCQYETSIFEGRGPEGHVLLRAIVGGTFDPQALELDDDALVARTVGDLERATGLRRTPDFTAIWRHPLGIPQYNLGHAARLAELDESLRPWAGLHMTGSALRGIGVADCITNAAALPALFAPHARDEAA